jgi:2-polyprenyl-3-methyl-5-hydroxy-6-metoxy-1,4-benzoquinol methylase
LYDAPAFDSRPKQIKRQYGLARCQSCMLVNTTGTDLDDVAEAYTTEYYGSASSKFLSTIEQILAFVAILRARKILRLWQEKTLPEKPPAVLDIGCGRGQLLRAFQSQGAHVLGLERKEFPTNEAPGDIVRVGSISDAEYNDRQFDIIILWHVLEHLQEHEKLLDELSDHQNKNGILIIAVPNFSSLQRRLFSKHWFHLDLPRHLVHFDSKWLVQQLFSRGYTVEYESYVDPLQNIFGFIQSAMNWIAPSRPNTYYRLLKHGHYLKGKSIVPLLSWSLLSMILLPFAISEVLLGALLRKGATVHLVARFEKNR